MKSCLILNPVSGSDSAPHYVEIIREHLTDNFGSLEVRLTEKAGDARDFAAQAVRDQCSHIFVGGGDGTLNEVLNGAANEPNGLAQVTFGLIPLGTGNDFANAALELPENVEETLEIFKLKNTVKVDVGKLNIDQKDHFFINVSAGGFIAEVSDAVDPQLKSITGKLAYLIGGASVLFDFTPFNAELSLHYQNGDVDKHDFAIEMFAVCNSKMLGGGISIAPDAVINDGLFEVCVFTATETTLEFLNILTQIASGVHLAAEQVKYFCVTAVDFKFDREVKVNTDGEVLTATHCRYEVLPSAATFLRK